MARGNAVDRYALVTGRGRGPRRQRSEASLCCMPASVLCWRSCSLAVAYRRGDHTWREEGVSSDVRGLSGLDRSRHVVVKLSALDSFGGGFVVQSFAGYWFYG